MVQGGRRLRIKILCISSTDKARLAVEFGADALGLVSHMPSGSGVIAIRQVPRGRALHFLHRIAQVTPPFWVGSTRKPGASSRHSRSSPCPGFLLPFLSGAMY